MEKAHKQELTREFLVSLDQEALVALVLQLDSKFQQLAEHTRHAMTEKYGQKTERFENSGQLLIFPSQHGESSQDNNVALTLASIDPKTEPVKKPTKTKQPGHARNPKPDLPHVPIYAEAPSPAELQCSCCGTERVATRQILQSSRYQFVPAKFYFEDLYSQVYECPGCSTSDSKQLVAKVPEIVENGTASSSLLAQIIVSRDFDHLPFNRQSAIYKRSGVNLNRSTLSDYYAQAAKILTPLRNYMQQILLQSDVISTDDTPVKVLDRLKAKSIKLGRIWVYFGDDAHPVTLFDYTESRGRDGPMTYLAGFKGRLQGDCFSGNLAICAAIDTILVACMAHARRYFVKSKHNDKEGSNTALSAFQALYETERTAKELELSPEDTRIMREQEAVPVLASFKTWLQQEQLAAPAKSSFGKAIFYCLNNWEALTQYVTDGRLSIDNNHSEREMKYIAMGRKAWLFFGSDQGGKNHATILSILSTCRRHNVEPWAYLTDIIQRLAENPNENLEDLLPYNWKVKYPQRPSAEIMAFLPTPKVA
ncbi:IS66 family transposase [soil metagenome]